MEEFEPKINENVTEHPVSYESLSAVRGLYKDDDRFNPATAYRVINLFNKLSIEDMTFAINLINKSYSEKVSEFIKKYSSAACNMSIASNSSEDMCLQLTLLY